MSVLNLNIAGMRRELLDANVALEENNSWDVEEYSNYIVNQYDITFLAVDWKFPQETAQILCTTKWNKQPWQKAYRA